MLHTQQKAVSCIVYYYLKKKLAQFAHNRCFPIIPRPAPHHLCSQNQKQCHRTKTHGRRAFHARLTIGVMVIIWMGWMGWMRFARGVLTLEKLGNLLFCDAPRKTAQLDDSVQLNDCLLAHDVLKVFVASAKDCVIEQAELVLNEHYQTGYHSLSM